MCHSSHDDPIEATPEVADRADAGIAEKSIQRDTRQQMVTRRRLLLAKALFQHALDHSRASDALDKMIAVHNFHNAIEITLRAILLEYDVRPEKELNLDFESLLNAIDRHGNFDGRDLRLPYRRELRKLNAVRNLVQHHAHEPEEATMEEWRVFCQRFLTRSFREYFGEAFDDLSWLQAVADDRLRRLLQLATQAQSDNRIADSACLSKIAFRYATAALAEHVPRRRDESLPPGLLRSSREDRHVEERIRRVIDNIYERIRDVEQYALVLASGVGAAEFARFQSVPIDVLLSWGGTPNRARRRGEVATDDGRWIHDFVLATVLRWQSAGLDPRVPERYASACDTFIREMAESDRTEADNERQAD